MSGHKTVCYDHTGEAYGNNTICPNSDTCCQTAEQCRSDRLCNSNQDSSVLVRAVCANYPWTYDSCATICVYGRDPDTGLFPRVQLCTDGSYCCDNEPLCCELGNGVFLDEHGAIIGRGAASSTTSSSTAISARLTWTTVSSSALTTSTHQPTAPIPASTSNKVKTQPSSPTSSTSSLPPASNNNSSSNSGLSKSGKIGIGVGVSVGVVTVVLLGLLWFFWRRRQKPRAYDAPPVYESYGDAPKDLPPQEVEASPREPAELPE